MTHRYEDLIIDIPDYPKLGVVFKDVTPVLADAEAADDVEVFSLVTV